MWCVRARSAEGERATRQRPRSRRAGGGTTAGAVDCGARPRLPLCRPSARQDRTGCDRPPSDNRRRRAPRAATGTVPAMIARPRMPGSDESLAQRLLDGDKRALARAITLVENDDPEGWALVREVYPRTGRAADARLHRAARSRQVDAAGGADQARARRATGRWRCCRSTPRRRSRRGALLGDRIRLADHFLDPGVFIRSMASRGALGGLERGGAAGGAADGRGWARRGPARDRRRRAGRGRHHRPRRHGRAGADARVGRLDPGARRRG